MPGNKSRNHTRNPICALLSCAHRCVSSSCFKLHPLLPHKLRKHLMWIDGNKQPTTPRQHLAFLILDLSHIDVPPSLYADLARLHPQRFVQRHRLEVVHGHLGSHRDDLTQLVHLAHSFIENGRDDAAVYVAGRSGEALVETETTDIPVEFLVVSKTQ